MSASIRAIRKHFVLAVLAATAALACSSTPMPVLSAKPSANQQVIYEDGAEKIISMRGGSVVSIRLSEPMGNRSTFVVGVANQSGASFVIGPEMVTVNQFGRSLRVFSYEEVKEYEQKKAQSARMTGLALGVMSNLAPMAGVPTTALQNSLQTAQRTMTTAVSAERSKTASLHELNLKEVSGTALKKNTLFPEQMNAGVVYSEKVGPGPITVRVQVGNDTHDFQFAL